jgi:hypothetical protein
MGDYVSPGQFQAVHVRNLGTTVYSRLESPYNPVDVVRRNLREQNTILYWRTRVQVFAFIVTELFDLPLKTVKLLRIR